MSYQERRALVNFASNVLITVLYSLYMVSRYPDGDAYSVEVFRFWGTFILILIPVSIAARIIVYIVFVILNTIATREMEPSISDERDRLIELKSARLSLYVFSLGFMVAMATLVVDQPPWVMFSVLILAGVLSDALSELTQFYFYRRGF